MGAFLTSLLGLLVVGGLLFLLASFVFGRGEQLAEMPPDGTPVELPDDRPVQGADVRELRLSVGLRGYRMDEVDWVLDQLATQLDERDREIAELRTELGQVSTRPAEPSAAPAVEAAPGTPVSVTSMRAPAPPSGPSAVSPAVPPPA